ncbi:MAG TPA: DNA translocase FtsK [Syntrophothermus lipocalidus]|uniref:Cell division protein FtsK/SpoIIIE n=1 Tax=Syntrophothermus lipocalidus (strain DSM 12680 / TGB-C1) TaxID=643648 RepID=D7CM82_SYNLT|nr:DNA translocase FtsK [Syntrophothermus lipocalidus]ADI01817.1 cell division protein FtsK/SpoIIIE [Syntrophothermus lipocalidus DSM 12680]HHV75831.1 DNA translocase FtsK [Syntrophothermus lipocalidus]HOV42398.1 DNA translocase FtsK 4TM domain-containing protein [Syntrophothermus lipocalidus]
MKKKQAQEQAKIEKKARSAVREEISGILLLALSVFLMVATLKYKGNPQDQEAIGIIGTYLIMGLEKATGAALPLVPVFLFLWAFHLLVAKRYWSLRMGGLALVSVLFLTFLSIARIPGGMDSLQAAAAGLGGGYLGGTVAYVLVHLLGRIGTYVVLVFGLTLGVIMAIDQPLTAVVTKSGSRVKKWLAALEPLLFYEAEDEVLAKEPAAAPIPVNKEDAAMPGPKDETEYREVAIRIAQPLSQQAFEKKADSRPEDSEYRRPPLELLSPVQAERGFNKNDIKESIKVLEDTFANFGIKVKVNQVSCGPAVTRYELQPAPGVKVSKIIGLADDLQLSLAAPGIRIEAPIPGKSAIGIEVPNERVTRVGLRNLLASPEFQGHESPLAVGLGEDISGNPVILDLAAMPHLLIAGSTGSGKSVCLNCIILSLLYGASPDELRLLLVDPKMVELTVYNGIPHLLAPVITDPKKASVGLRWMVTEMEQRYQKFSETGVRDIYRYNEVSGEQLPFIVIVIDELADLMTIAPVEVEDSICRLAQMARAAGIHLVVATQRPSVDVVTGIIKANIPSRIAFAVSSQSDSRTILDMAGAEKLLGRGDMLVYPVGAPKPFRVQGAFVSDTDIEAVVAFVRQQNLTTPIREEQDIGMDMVMGDVGYQDDLFWDAVKIFLQSQKVSVSLLQRKLRIGYARAARLVDMMEERGIISPPDVNKKRDILIDEEQFARLYSNDNMC